MDNIFNQEALAIVPFDVLWQELSRRCEDAVLIADIVGMHKGTADTTFYYKGTTAQVLGLLTYGQTIVNKNIFQKQPHDD